MPTLYKISPGPKMFVPNRVQNCRLWRRVGLKNKRSSHYGGVWEVGKSSTESQRTRRLCRSWVKLFVLCSEKKGGHSRAIRGDKEREGLGRPLVKIGVSNKGTQESGVQSTGH